MPAPAHVRGEGNRFRRVPGDVDGPARVEREAPDAHAVENDRIGRRGLRLDPRDQWRDVLLRVVPRQRRDREQQRREPDRCEREPVRAPQHGFEGERREDRERGVEVHVDARADRGDARRGEDEGGPDRHDEQQGTLDAAHERDDHREPEQRDRQCGRERGETARDVRDREVEAGRQASTVVGPEAARLFPVLAQRRVRRGADGREVPDAGDGDVRRARGRDEGALRSRA